MKNHPGETSESTWWESILPREAGPGVWPALFQGSSLCLHRPTFFFSGDYPGGQACQRGMSVTLEVSLDPAVLGLGEESVSNLK